MLGKSLLRTVKPVSAGVDTSLTGLTKISSISQAICSSAYAGYPAQSAFNDVPADWWATQPAAAATANEWIGQYGLSQKVYKLQIKTYRNNDNFIAPFVFEYSEDNINWVQINPTASADITIPAEATDYTLRQYKLPDYSLASFSTYWFRIRATGGTAAYSWFVNDVTFWSKNDYILPTFSTMYNGANVYATPDYYGAPATRAFVKPYTTQGWWYSNTAGVGVIGAYVAQSGITSPIRRVKFKTSQSPYHISVHAFEHSADGVTWTRLTGVLEVNNTVPGVVDYFDMVAKIPAYTVSGNHHFRIIATVGTGGYSWALGEIEFQI